MEDNSAVITITNDESALAKKCKHFLMVVNYVKEQIALGQIQARKIYGKLNNADLHTKPLHCPSYTTMAHRIFGQPLPCGGLRFPLDPACRHKASATYAALLFRGC